MRSFLSPSKGFECLEIPLVAQSSWWLIWKATLGNTRFCFSRSWRYWLLLLMRASTRANFWLRMVMPEETRDFAERHDGLVWECLKGVLGTPTAPWFATAIANLPLSMGGLGLTNALEVRTAAFWAPWAHSMKMVKERHPTIANEMMVGIDREESLCFQSVGTCQQLLVEAAFVVTPWSKLVNTPPQAELEPGPNQPKFGWQQRAARQFNELSREQVRRSLTNSERAILRVATRSVGPRRFHYTPDQQSHQD